MKKKLTLFAVCFSFLVVFALKNYDEQVVIIYTSNINAVLEDCGCGGEKLGGLARLKTVIDSYRAKYKKVYLIDTGDSFSSFYYPEKNHFLQQVMQTFEYDFIMKADQEFNSGSNFIDYYFNNKEMFNYYMPNDAFEFVADSLLPNPLSYSYLDKSPFLVYHGDTTSFQANKHKFKDHKFVFLSHSQELIEQEYEQYTLLQSGMDTEHVGIAIFAKNGDNYSLESNQFLRLESTIKEDPATLEKVLAFYKHLEDKKAYGGDSSKKFLYLSSTYCKSCHEPEYQAWKKSAHAHAFETLKHENKAFDQLCVGCHTTGYQKGGYKSYVMTPDLVNVQCESCHVNLPADHNTASQKLVRKAVDRSLCISCHTSKNSPKFDYSTYLAKIKHWDD